MSDIKSSFTLFPESQHRANMSVQTLRYLIFTRSRVTSLNFSPEFVSMSRCETQCYTCKEPTSVMFTVRPSPTAKRCQCDICNLAYTKSL